MQDWQDHVAILPALTASLHESHGPRTSVGFEGLGLAGAEPSHCTCPLPEAESAVSGPAKSQFGW